MLLQKKICSVSSGVGGLASFRRVAASLILAIAFFHVMDTDMPLQS